ncbi:MAG TPA: flagellar hook-basal body complex protein FliE [Desulfobulbus sp.]|nr:flagellar hook-basal body complex protein FliE [Desulfobulbus sp.]
MQPIHGIQLTTVRPADKKSEANQAEQNFGKMLSGLVGDVQQQQQAADQAMQQVHAGNAKNLHEAMIAMEQADISIRFMVQVRNKAMDAYQEIMRMQV